MKFKEKLEDYLAKHPIRAGFITGGHSLAVAAANWYVTKGLHINVEKDIQSLLWCVVIPLGIGTATAYVGKILEKNKENQKKLEELAQEDPLTGLYNRRGFEDKLKEIAEFVYRGKEKMIMLNTDIDDMKKINDEQPDKHEAGDRALKHTATALKRALPRYTDAVGRVGGDEFKGAGIIKEKGMEEGKQKILKRFDDYMKTAEEEVGFQFTASIGYEVIDPNEFKNPNEFENMKEMVEYVMSKAGKDMYKAKEIKKNSAPYNS